MRHDFILGCVTASAIALFSQAASASVRYNFTSEPTSVDYLTPNDTFTGSFSVILPDYVTAQIDLPLSEMSSCSATATSGATVHCMDRPNFYAVHFEILPGWWKSTRDIIELDLVKQVGQMSSGFGLPFVFDISAFSTPGIHHTVSSYGFNFIGTLNVTQVTETPAVPEPATWTTLLAGCGVIGWALRRRQSATARSA